MGETNPRQVCFKSYCPYETFNFKELLETKIFHLRESPYYIDSVSTHYDEYNKVIKKFIDDNSNCMDIDLIFKMDDF